MNTYLYTWNPERWTWSDLPEAVVRVNTGEPYTPYWSCGQRKHLEIGDQFLLMRLVVEPKGIVGCGTILSEPYLKPHWDPVLAAQGKMAPRTDVLFSALAETPLIPLAELQSQFSGYNWTPQSGGMGVPELIASSIFDRLRTDLGHTLEPWTSDKLQTFIEGQPKKVTITTYDRSVEARQACLEAQGYACQVCGFDFANHYGELGRGYIEVHHRTPIASVGEAYEIDPVKDLAPVCANCHRMLHRQQTPLSIDELKARIQPT